MGMNTTGKRSKYNAIASMDADSQAHMAMVRAELALESLGENVPEHVRQTIAWLKSQQSK